jgi:hypothetical protein
LITQIIFGKEYRSLSSSLCSSFPLPCYLISLRPKYSSQHPTVEHTWPTFLPQPEWPSFMPIQNNRQNFNFVYLRFYIFV